MASPCLRLLSARRAARLIHAILKMPILFGFTATLQPLERSRGYTRTNALRLSVNESEQDEAKNGQMLGTGCWLSWRFWRVVPDRLS